MDQKICSADGSETFYSAEFKECYHSLKDGARNETLYKHVYPPMLFAQTLNKPSLKILDLCFGLGYNSFYSAWAYLQRGYEGAIRIVSPEIDRGVFDKILEIKYPKDLDFIDKRALIDRIKEQGCVKLHEKIMLEVKILDALEYVRNLQAVDIIYHDAFCMKSTPQFWNLEFFATLFEILKPDGIITTYTTHQNIYEIAKKQGFRVYQYCNEICRKSTLLTKHRILKDAALREI